MKIGIDIGGMSVKYGLVDENNQIVGRYTLTTDTEIKAEEFIDLMAKGVDSLLKEGGIKAEQIQGMGIGCPGIINSKTGTVVYSNNIGWRDVAMEQQLKNHFSWNIAMANDADTAGLGEVCAGAGKGIDNAVLLTLGTGVGSSVIINKKIFSGPLNGGCELGHISIDPKGRLCTCGHRGCLEAYASASALMIAGKELVEQNPNSALAKLADGKEVTAKMIFDCSETGDAATEQVVTDYMDSLALGISNVINIFRPQLVILGGGVANRKEKLTKPLTPLVNDLVFGGVDGEIPPIVTSILGNDAGIVGAANLV